MRFEIEQTQWGMAIIGSAPVGEVASLAKDWDKRGFKILDFALCEALGACLVVVRSVADGKAWRESLGIRADHKDWLKSGDAGISSKTIYARMTGHWGCLDRGKEGANVPHDPSDFGRCYRLLKRHPEWIDRLPEVAEMFPRWRPLVREWQRMTALYEEELPTDAAPKLYALMQKLRAESV